MTLNDPREPGKPVGIPTSERCASTARQRLDNALTVLGHAAPRSEDGWPALGMDPLHAADPAMLTLELQQLRDAAHDPDDHEAALAAVNYRGLGLRELAQIEHITSPSTITTWTPRTAR